MFTLLELGIAPIVLAQSKGIGRPIERAKAIAVPIGMSVTSSPITINQSLYICEETMPSLNLRSVGISGGQLV